MGTWRSDSFENDDALDWISQLELSEDTSLIEATLKAATEDDEKYLELSVCNRAIAASEVVSAFVGGAQSHLPMEAVNWLSKQRFIHTDREHLVQLALFAIARIRTDSELKELWDESGNEGDWHNALGKLEARLEFTPYSSPVTVSNPTAPAPWLWYIPATMAFVFGVGGGAVVTYLNFKRFEETEDDIRWQTIITVGFALLVVIFLSSISVPSFAVNVVVGLIFLMFQKSGFEEWSRNNPGRNPSSWWKALGWAILGGIVYLVLVIILFSLLGIPLTSQPRNLRPLR